MLRAARGVADRACDATRRRYIGQREADAVAEWIASGQPLHFMHDHAATMELQVARHAIYTMACGVATFNLATDNNTGR
jgi:hypothetical protein